MRAIIQRVTQATVTVDNQTVGEIGLGLLILLGIEPADTPEDIEWLGVVSQFTLFANTKKGNRPSFIRAAPPEFAERMYIDFCRSLEELLGKPVQRGVFGAHMSVQLTNDGPVTIWIDTKEKE